MEMVETVKQKREKLLEQFNSLQDKRVELEKQLFHDLGPEKIESLETLRKRYGSRKEWKGPLFEAVPEKKADS